MILLGAYFIDEWNLLKAAGNNYPPTVDTVPG
jgi:hypothetical protein